MAVFDNLNGTYSSGVAPSVTEYFERKLLDHVRNNHVYGMDTQKRALPAHNGRTVQFRKWTPFAPIDEPLKEGVTPDGQTLSMTELRATIKPYGRHVELTDEMDWALLDSPKKDVATLLAEQAADSIEAITRDGWASGTNVQYVGQTSRGAITSSNILTYAEIKKAVRTLKKNGAKPFADGFYHAIVGADTVHDLTSDAMWVDVAKYQDKARVSQYELGSLYKVKFFESSMPMIFKTKSYLYGTTASLALTAWDEANKVATVAKTSLGADDAAIAYAIRCLVGQMVCLKDASASNTPVTGYIERITIEGASAKIHFRWATGTLTYASGDLIVPTGGGASGVDVHGTIVYGQDACGEVSLDGSGKNIQIIIKPAGSSGASDPLNQRGTAAWKVKGFCATILQDAFVVRIEHGVSA